MRYLNNYQQYRQTNEGLKNWLSTFLLLANLGLVPMSLKASQDSVAKKEFVESQPDSKIDAAKFLNFLTKNGHSRPVNLVWDEFIKSDSSIKSSLPAVQKYISRDGKVYNFDKKYKVQDFSHVDIHKFTPTNWTTDMGSFYADSLEPNLNNWIADYEQKTSIEIGIVTVKSLTDKDGNSEEIEDYAGQEFERLGVGKKVADNGILIIFSMDDRKSRIQTGRGMEEFLTDYQCKEILSNVVRPYFKEGKYYEGTMAALESIKKEMGEEPFSKKVEWLKQKQAKEKLESDKREQANEAVLLDIFLWGLLIAAIIGPIIYLYKRNEKNREFKKDLDSILKTIEHLKSTIPNSSKVSSQKLILALNKLKTLAQEDNIKKGKKDEYLADLVKYGGELDSAIREYKSLKNAILKKVSDIENWNSITNNAISVLDSAILAYKEVKELGYNASKPADTSEIEKLNSLGEQAKSLLQTNVDDAMTNFNAFKNKVNSVVSTGQSAISTLSSIKSAKRNVEDAKTSIDAALYDMERYKKWKKTGEEVEVTSAINSFYSISKFEKDVLKSNNNLQSVISKINDMRDKWKKRKDEEDDEERRKREESSYSSSSYSSSSYDSYSSSSSSSSDFGGFSGGSSSGGGASDSW